jgi:hypothetical protein
LTIDEIGDRAGVHSTTVRNALHEARRLGHVQIIERRRPSAKSLPNLVKIISADWLAWMKRAPNAARQTGSNSKNVNALNNIDEEKKETSDPIRETGARATRGANPFMTLSLSSESGRNGVAMTIRGPSSI